MAVSCYSIAQARAHRRKADWAVRLNHIDSMRGVVNKTRAVSPEARKKLLVKILRQMKADGRLPTAVDEEIGT